MSADKIKQYVAMLGGALGGVLLFLQSLDIELTHFNDKTIQSFTDMLVAVVPFVFVVYGIWKNQYIVSDKAKKQEEVLKEKGLK